MLFCKPLLIKLPAFLVIICTLLSVTSVKASAQEEFVPPPAEKITTFPFLILTGGVIVIRATLDSIPDSLNFVLDTGSGGISLDSSTCQYFNLKRQPSDRIIRGIAGMRTVDFSYNHSLKLPGLTVEKLDFHINDYDILTSVYGLKIDGIVGYSFLRRFLVTIDYDKMLIDVYKPGTFKYPKGGYLLKPQFSTLPMQTARIKDDRPIDTRFYFDTGAGLCLLLSQDLVTDSLLLKKDKKIFETQAEGLGGKKDMRLAVIKEVKIGPYKFKKVPIYIFNDEFNVTSYPSLGGLIGNDLLRRFNVIINYPEQQIYLKPNMHYGDDFDYSYTGLGIYIVNGAITVVDIIKDSPAEKAGFKEGDIIIGVDNNLGGNIQVYKTLMQNSGAKLRVIISRNNQLQTINLKVKSIL